jgi:hypothetical protein
MIFSWLIFIAVALIMYAGFVKLAARLLRYNVSWKYTFFFAGIMMVVVIVDHVLVVSEPVATRIGHAVVLLLGLVIFGGWFFRERGTSRSGTILGWSGGVRLIALAFSMIIVVGSAIVISAQMFLSNSSSAR